MAKVCAVPNQQLWIDRRQVQLAEPSRYTALQRSPNGTLSPSETGQEEVTVAAEVAELPSTTTRSNGTEGTTVPRMSLPLVPSLRLGQTRKASRWSRKWEQSPKKKKFWVLQTSTVLCALLLEHSLDFKRDERNQTARGHKRDNS